MTSTDDLRKNLGAICSQLIEQRCKAASNQNLFASVMVPKTGGGFEGATECVIIAKRGNPIFDQLMQIIMQSNAQRDLAQVSGTKRPKIDIVRGLPPGLKP